MKLKALIISIKGTKLSKSEKIILSKKKPWGIILFKRNLKSNNQIKKLTSEIKRLTKNNKFPIIIFTASATSIPPTIDSIDGCTPSILHVGIESSSSAGNMQ